MEEWARRGLPPIPYLGEKQIDRGNNDKLQKIISNSGHNVQRFIQVRPQSSIFNCCIFIGGVIYTPCSYKMHSTITFRVQIRFQV
jgi:hypothetical protein